MTASASDILFHKTAENTSAGGVDSGVLITDARNSFMPAITDLDRIAGGSRIKKFAVNNDHATDVYTQPECWITPGTGITEELGLGYDDGDDDDSAQGNLDPLSGNSDIALVSDGSDTRTVTLTGLNAAGATVSEDVVLDGTNEVVGALTFSVFYGTLVDATDGSNTITVKEGSAGPTLGTIGPTFKCAWLWVDATSQGNGILLDDLAAQTSYCFWWRQTWAANVAGQRPDTSVINVIDH